jgi:hypothetical protein
MTATAATSPTLPDPVRTPTLPLWPDAAQLLGLGKYSAYEAVRTGQWPTTVIRVGRKFRIPTAELLRLLGAYSPTTTTAA